MGDSFNMHPLNRGGVTNGNALKLVIAKKLHKKSTELI